MNPASAGTAPDAAALASCTIGVDMGTTTLKAAAFDAAGRELAHAARHVKLFHPARGGPSRSREPSPRPSPTRWPRCRRRPLPGLCHRAGGHQRGDAQPHPCRG